MKGVNGSKGREEEEIHIHEQERVTGMTSKQEAKESNTLIGRVMSLSTTPDVTTLLVL